MRRYPSSHPWHVCSLRISITRPSGERRSSPGSVAAIQVRSVASKRRSRRFDAVSSGPITRKFLAPAFRFITSRSILPITRVASAVAPPGFGTSTAYSR